MGRIICPPEIMGVREMPLTIYSTTPPDTSSPSTTPDRQDSKNPTCIPLRAQDTLPAPSYSSLHPYKQDTTRNGCVSYIHCYFARRVHINAECSSQSQSLRPRQGIRSRGRYLRTPSLRTLAAPWLINMFIFKQATLSSLSRTFSSRCPMTTQLVHLPEVERLSPLVIRILGGNPGKV